MSFNYSTYGPDFYPTPISVIEKLLDGLNIGELASFLEPSGGKGDICKYIRTHLEEYTYRSRDFDIDVIEINPELRHILRGEGFRVVHDDFLTYETRKGYDLIVANFPFSEGDKHLAHALRLLEQHGGILRCLVNAETLRTPHTTLRQALATKLHYLNAEIEYLPGQFEAAERATSVEVALIKVEIEPREPFSMILDSMKQAREIEINEAAPQDLVSTHLVEAIVAAFNAEADAGIKLLSEFYAMRPRITDEFKRDKKGEQYGRPLLKLEIDGRPAGTSMKADVNSYLRLTRKKYWYSLLNNDQFTSQFTSNLINEMWQKLDELKDYDFTVFNIEEMQKEMGANIVQGVEAAILDLFDTCSRQYAYGHDFGTNIHYYNGWKTNKAHMINQKIILPM